MKKVLLTTFLVFGIVSISFAQNDPFSPVAKDNTQRYFSGDSTGMPRGMDPEIEMLKEELRMQLEEMRSLKNDLQKIQEENTEEARKEKEVNKRKKESDFVGIVDGVRLYKDKESGEFFTLTESEFKENESNEIDKEEG